jgi:hypothetical protein
LYLIHKKDVEHDVVLLVIEAVFDANYFEDLWALLAYFDDVSVYLNELTLATAIHSPDQIANFEAHQIHLSKDLVVDL